MALGSPTVRSARYRGGRPDRYLGPPVTPSLDPLVNGRSAALIYRRQGLHRARCRLRGLAPVEVLNFRNGAHPGVAAEGS